MNSSISAKGPWFHLVCVKQGKAPAPLVEQYLLPHYQYSICSPRVCKPSQSSTIIYLFLYTTGPNNVHHDIMLLSSLLIPISPATHVPFISRSYKKVTLILLPLSHLLYLLLTIILFLTPSPTHWKHTSGSSRLTQPPVAIYTADSGNTPYTSWSINTFFKEYVITS